MKVAVIQLCASDNKGENLKKVKILIEKVVKNKAQLLLLPEIFNFRGKIETRNDLKVIAESISGESISLIKMLARKYGVCILAGSIYERSKDGQEVYNTSVFVNERGTVSGVYRKINLFKANIGRRGINETDKFTRGNKKIIVSAFGFKLGLSICYDLRFPAMFSYYAKKGVDVICIPSAFTYETGKSHWEVLLRSRAIETLCYVLAPNQIGQDTAGIKSYGHSMIIDPWGKVLCNAQEKLEKIIYAEVSRKEISQRRNVFSDLNGFKKHKK